MRRVYPQFWALLFAVVLSAAFAIAAGEREIPLKQGPDGEGAGGGLIISIRNTGTATRGLPEKEITINAVGLKPDSVYTVWLVNKTPRKEMKGLGDPDYSFRSDNKGNGSYTALIPAPELDKWKMLEIARNPDGNPENTKDMRIALEAALR